MKKDGFTLIEIMIIVVIIGILTSMAIPMFTSATAKSKRSEAHVVLKNIWELQNAYYAFHGHYWPQDGYAIAPAGVAITWKDISFEIGRNHRYSYSVQSAGEALVITGIAEGKGDIDGDAFPDHIIMDQYGKMYIVLDDLFNSASGGGPPPATSASENRFTQDFESDDALDDWDIVRGDFTVDDGSLHIDGRATGYWGDESWEDYTIEFNANLHSGRGFGLFFRSSGGRRDDSYIFQYDPGLRDRFVMRERTNGREARPFERQRMGSDFDVYNTDHDFKIEVQGEEFVVYVDGNEVLRGSDDSYSSGLIGIRTWNRNTSLDLDNLSVTVN